MRSLSALDAVFVKLIYSSLSFQRSPIDPSELLILFVIKFRLAMVRSILAKVAA
jgi:hypothetical protein